MCPWLQSTTIHFYYFNFIGNWLILYLEINETAKRQKTEENKE